MRGTKIAPNLDAMVTWLEEKGNRGGVPYLRRELRALLAVARAAERHASWLRATHPDDGMPRLRPTEMALMRAVARSVSAGKRGTR